MGAYPYRWLRQGVAWLLAEHVARSSNPKALTTSSPWLAQRRITHIYREWTPRCDEGCEPTGVDDIYKFNHGNNFTFCSSGPLIETSSLHALQVDWLATFFAFKDFVDFLDKITGFRVL